ncbi:uncharacterized protein LOC116684162 [Etheostoma spectabile]|uniref:uncharacterized protein LOC116684162 n=1 Tax=Etheostoma spectabile TaxID=54343 RepID=UPI0013AF6362|nr:uncharacterized protein LOC116684162 [Etheostoma spectabile]
MLICDGSIVLLQSLSYNFCGMSLQELICRYYMIVTGQAQEDSMVLPILHRCLSHVLKNAKVLCRKHASRHYHLAMHVFGRMTQATTLEEMDEVLLSATMVFSSSHSGTNVEKHFQNLQKMLTEKGQCGIDDTAIVEQDFGNGVGPTPFQHHFEDVIKREELEKEGDSNVYFSPTFIPTLLKYFLPQAALWSGLLLGDLGRHGTGPVYEKLSQRFKRTACKPTQNYTQDNQTQGIMEKSQWDLKKIRFQRRRLTRLDDFVYTYKITLNALLREYRDSLKTKKTHRVDVERWKHRKQKKQGVYVSQIAEPFVFKNQKSKCIVFSESQLNELWKKRDTEVVVSVVPSHITGNSILIHHSELRTLRPHFWITGEIIESLFHHTVNDLNLGRRIYILNHYVAGVILFGKREVVRRNSLSRTNFDNYQAIVSFVNYISNKQRVFG